jgi:acyl dehydratase
MSTTPFKHRVAHGMLTMSMSSCLSTQFADASPVLCVSYGYDAIRFLKPVYIGDTITATYTIEKVDEEAAKTFAKLETKNQRGELVLVATHILKYFF